MNATDRKARYARSFPVLSGEVVTQGHTDWCRDHGHATHSVDGVPDPFCPRCGASVGETEQPAAATANTMLETMTAGMNLADLPHGVAVAVEQAISDAHDDALGSWLDNPQRELNLSRRELLTQAADNVERCLRIALENGNAGAIERFDAAHRVLSRALES